MKNFIRVQFKIGNIEFDRQMEVDQAAEIFTLADRHIKAAIESNGQKAGYLEKI